MLTNDEVLRRRRKLEERLLAADRRWEHQTAKLRKELDRLQGKCKHTRTTYHDDPAGGNGDFSECVNCGARL